MIFLNPLNKWVVDKYFPRNICLCRIYHMNAYMCEFGSDWIAVQCLSRNNNTHSNKHTCNYYHCSVWYFPQLPQRHYMFQNYHSTTNSLNGWTTNATQSQTQRLNKWILNVLEFLHLYLYTGKWQSVGQTFYKNSLNNTPRCTGKWKPSVDDQTHKSHWNLSLPPFRIYWINWFKNLY